MYCTTCDCEYEGWSGKCPNCKNQLQEGIPPSLSSGQGQLDYESLVTMVKDHGGRITIQLKTSEVGKSKTTRFPWLGYGFAWTKRMIGSANGINVDLSTTKVGKDKKWRFPYQGHGFGWRQEMQGAICGNEITLTADKVIKRKTWGFPYFGYGYSWTEEMSGKIGQELFVELKNPTVRKIRRWLFPYFGFGYAWVSEGELSLSLI